MKHSARLALLTGTLLPLMATTAWGADQISTPQKYSLYLRGYGGMSKVQGMEYDINAGEIRNEHERGNIVSGAIGLDMGNNFMAEVEIARRSSDIKKQSLLGVSLPNSSGNTSSTAFMVNGYYETPTDSMFRPYVGLGMGIADVTLEEHKTGATTLVNDGQNVFAYQGMGGLAFNVSDNFTIFGEYRYFATHPVQVTTATNTTHEAAYETHNILAGVKYRFK